VSNTIHRFPIVVCAALGLLWPSMTAADAGERAGRGVAAIVAPILEIPGNVTRTSEREGAAKGWTEGLARGIGMSVIRPPVGFYELVTAPFPALADDPPVLRPDYPWSYFTTDGEGDSLAGR